MPRQRSHDELAAAVEDNLFDLFRAMAALPGGVIREDGRLLAYRPESARPSSTASPAARLADDEVDAAVDGVVESLGRRGLGFFW
jgi:hypothetical protein